MGMSHNQDPKFYFFSTEYPDNNKTFQVPPISPYVKPFLYILLPVVPHKAVAEVSKIGNL